MEQSKGKGKAILPPKGINGNRISAQHPSPHILNNALLSNATINSESVNKKVIGQVVEREIKECDDIQMTTTTCGFPRPFQKPKTISPAISVVNKEEYQGMKQETHLERDTKNENELFEDNNSLVENEQIIANLTNVEIEESISELQRLLPAETISFLRTRGAQALSNDKNTPIKLMDKVSSSANSRLKIELPRKAEEEFDLEGVKVVDVGSAKVTCRLLLEKTFIGANINREHFNGYVESFVRLVMDASIVVDQTFIISNEIPTHTFTRITELLHSENSSQRSIAARMCSTSFILRDAVTCCEAYNIDDLDWHHFNVYSEDFSIYAKVFALFKSLLDLTLEYLQLNFEMKEIFPLQHEELLRDIKRILVFVLLTFCVKDYPADFPLVLKMVSCHANMLSSSNLTHALNILKLCDSYLSSHIEDYVELALFLENRKLPASPLMSPHLRRSELSYHRQYDDACKNFEQGNIKIKASLKDFSSGREELTLMYRWNRVDSFFGPGLNFTVVDNKQQDFIGVICHQLIKQSFECCNIDIENNLFPFSLQACNQIKIAYYCLKLCCVAAKNGNENIVEKIISMVKDNWTQFFRFLQLQFHSYSNQHHLIQKVLYFQWELLCYLSLRSNNLVSFLISFDFPNHLLGLVKSNKLIDLTGRFAWKLFTIFVTYNSNDIISFCADTVSYFHIEYSKAINAESDDVNDLVIFLDELLVSCMRKLTFDIFPETNNPNLISSIIRILVDCTNKVEQLIEFCYKNRIKLCQIKSAHILNLLSSFLGIKRTNLDLLDRFCYRGSGLPNVLQTQTLLKPQFLVESLQCLHVQVNDCCVQLSKEICGTFDSLSITSIHPSYKNENIILAKKRLILCLYSHDLIHYQDCCNFMLTRGISLFKIGSVCNGLFVQTSFENSIVEDLFELFFCSFAPTSEFLCKLVPLVSKTGLFVEYKQLTLALIQVFCDRTQNEIYFTNLSKSFQDMFYDSSEESTTITDLASMHYYETFNDRKPFEKKREFSPSALLFRLRSGPRTINMKSLEYSGSLWLFQPLGILEPSSRHLLLQDIWSLYRRISYFKRVLSPVDVTQNLHEIGTILYYLIAFVLKNNETLQPSQDMNGDDPLPMCVTGFTSILKLFLDVIWECRQQYGVSNSLIFISSSFQSALELDSLGHDATSNSSHPSYRELFLHYATRLSKKHNDLLDQYFSLFLDNFFGQRSSQEIHASAAMLFTLPNILPWHLAMRFWNEINGARLLHLLNSSLTNDCFAIFVQPINSWRSCSSTLYRTIFFAVVDSRDFYQDIRLSIAGVCLWNLAAYIFMTPGTFIIQGLISDRRAATLADIIADLRVNSCIQSAIMTMLRLVTIWEREKQFFDTLNEMNLVECSQRMLEMYMNAVNLTNVALSHNVLNIPVCINQSRTSLQNYFSSYEISII